MELIEANSAVILWNSYCGGDAIDSFNIGTIKEVELFEIEEYRISDRIDRKYSFSAGCVYMWWRDASNEERLLELFRICCAGFFSHSVQESSLLQMSRIKELKGFRQMVFRFISHDSPYEEMMEIHFPSEGSDG